MSIWNERYQEKGWSTTQAYAKASRSGFCIEALVLSINMLKSIMFVVLENEYKKRGVSETKIKKRLSSKKDVGDLISLMRDAKILTQEEIKRIEDYWKLRNDTVHTFIDGKVEYEDVCTLVQEFKHVYGLVQNKIFKIEISNVEKIENL